MTNVSIKQNNHGAGKEILLVFKAIRVVIDVDVVLKGAVLIALTHVIGTKKLGKCNNLPCVSSSFLKQKIFGQMMT